MRYACAANKAQRIMGDFLTISGMKRADLVRLLQATRRNLPVADGTEPSRTSLQGRVIANLFFEDSTRTRCSSRRRCTDSVAKSSISRQVARA